MRQHEITQAHPLLNEQGQVIESGYAKTLILDYHRLQVKASRFRIKEWDYYFIGSDDYGISVTIADLSYIGLVGVTFFQFKEKKKFSYSDFRLFPMGKFQLPHSSQRGDISYRSKKITLDIKVTESLRTIYCHIPRFHNGKSLTLDVLLTDPPRDSMVIVTPFKEDPRAFYYNQKLNNLSVTGEIHFGHQVYDLSKKQAVLDWGRGVWTYDNTWYWSSLSDYLPDGSKFGFNLGYGFEDTSKATENMIFYQGVAHKLEEIDFGIPQVDGQDDFLSPWHFTSSDGRFEASFEPIYDNYTNINFIFIQHLAHQVFGYFSGYAILDDGKKITFNRLFGFAEKVRNRW